MEHIDLWLRSLSEKRILVVGDVMLDRYLMGNVHRISPEAPVPVVDLQSREDRLGGAGNVALNIQAMGAQALLCGLVGADADGEVFLEQMRRNRLDTSMMVITEDRRTTVKSRVIAGRQHLLRVDQEDRHPFSEAEGKRLVDLIVNTLDNGAIDLILFQDYNKGMLTPGVISGIIEAAHEREIPTVVDPKEDNFFAFKGVTLFKPNLREIQQAIGRSVTSDLSDLKAANLHLKQQLQHQQMLITLSENGLFYDDGTTAALYPTQARTIVDVCGAGDTVVSVAALALLGKLSSDELARLANLAGGQVCEQIGVVTVNRLRLVKEFLGQ